jgi:hypothetical protein
MNPTIIIETKRLTLDDFLQLQSLLKHEQEERDRHIQACHHHQQSIHIHRAINPQAAHQSRLEKERLEQALVKLKYLKDQYRRQRATEIQAYLEAYRQQALIRAVQQEEEERYYRQCIAAALEQRRVNYLWQKYMDEKRQETLQEQFEKQQLLSDNNQHVSEDSEEENQDYSQYHSEQLADLLKQVFNQEQEQKQPSPDALKSDDEDAMAEVWKYVFDQKVNSETPRTAFLSSEQDKILGSKSFPDNPDVNKPCFEIEAQDNADSLSDAASSPPLQDHVVTLKDLIQQLASEPVLVGEQVTNYSDEPKPSGIWAKKQQQEARASLLNNQKDLNDQDEPKAYLPQHIFTEAEPTPTLENMPNTPIDTAPEEDTQEELSHFVDSVAAEQKNQVALPNPQKLKMQQELHLISDQLSHTSDLVQRWEKVLESTLEFTKQPEGTLLLNANTDANRQFLGSEDEIMRLMLRLDAIDSFGNDKIREDRRDLVKKCESMLDQLDHLKQTQWEKVISSTNHQQKKRSSKKKASF